MVLLASCLITYPFGCGLGTSFTVNGGADDTTGIARTLAAGIESLQAHVLQRLVMAQDAQGAAGTRLYTDYDGFVAEESMLLSSP